MAACGRVSAYGRVGGETRCERTARYGTVRLAHLLQLLLQRRRLFCKGRLFFVQLVNHPLRLNLKLLLEVHNFRPMPLQFHLRQALRGEVQWVGWWGRELGEGEGGYTQRSSPGSRCRCQRWETATRHIEHAAPC